MSLTYTVFRTETLEGGQVRIYQGYEVSGVGVVLNMLLKMTIADKEVRLLDEEIFIPGATATQFSGMSWTVEDTRTLDLGQKRYVRSFVPNSTNKVIELYRTVKQNIDGAFEMVAQAQLYATTPLVVPVAPSIITGNAGSYTGGAWVDILQYSAGPALAVPVTLTRARNVRIQLRLNAYNDVGTGFFSDFRVLQGASEILWGRNRFTGAFEDRVIHLARTLALVAGSYTFTAQVLPNGSVGLAHGAVQGGELSLLLL